MHHVILCCWFAMVALVYGAGIVAAITPRAPNERPTESEADTHGCP